MIKKLIINNIEYKTIIVLNQFALPISPYMSIVKK